MAFVEVFVISVLCSFGSAVVGFGFALLLLGLRSLFGPVVEDPTAYTIGVVAFFGLAGFLAPFAMH